ncbi:SH3 domain-containing protein, partial [Acinetobacter soli]
MPSGRNVTYLGTYGSWYKVSYGRQTGYVSAQYVKVSTSTTTTTAKTYVTTVNLNLRKSASSTGTILLTIPSGRSVTYL